MVISSDPGTQGGGGPISSRCNIIISNTIRNSKDRRIPSIHNNYNSAPLMVVSQSQGGVTNSSSNSSACINRYGL